MVRIKTNKKGQAAIEFLMTYGWMLLVVLIVGALIFSFVDFGTLLPNKFDLSNNLRGDPTGSIAYSNKATAPDTNQVKLVFRYNGAKRVTVGPADANILPELGGACPAVNVTNLDTNTTTNVSVTTMPFLNGQDGIISFDCSSISGGLLPGDSLVGNVEVGVVDPKSNLKIPSTGSLRIQIN